MVKTIFTFTFLYSWVGVNPIFFFSSAEANLGFCWLLYVLIRQKFAKPGELNYDCPMMNSFFTHFDEEGSQDASEAKYHDQ